MKKQFMTKLFAIIALAITIINPLAASAKELGELPAGKEFDVNKFENYLRSKLDGNAVGYTFVIYQYGKYLRSGNYGYAVLKKDDPKMLSSFGFSLMPETRMNIASVTKTITATAVLKAMQDKKVLSAPGMTYSSPIDFFLPSSWTRGPGIKDLTIRELMSQYSGMNDNKGLTGISDLQKWIKTGVTRKKTDYLYINGNLAIFRVILPYMLATSATRKAWDKLAADDPAKFNQTVSDRFKEIVRELVFTPSGLQNIDMTPGSYPTRWYNQSNSAPGYVDIDWTLVGGGGGWVMSAYDLAQFMAHLRYDDKLLTPATRKVMDDNVMGWEDPAFWWQFRGKYGNYLGHGGGLIYNKSDPKTIVGMNSVIINYPSGVQGVLLINSLGNYPNKAQLMKDAFDAAVVVKQIKTK